MVLIPSGYGQANMRWGGPAFPTGAETTFGFQIGGAIDTPEDAAMAVATAVESTGIVTNFPTHVSLESVLVKFGPNATGPSAVVAGFSQGTSGVSPAPNTATLVRKVTGSGGRAGRGRMFWPGPAESLIDPGGVIDAEFRNNFQSDLNAWHTALVNAGLTPMVLHGPGSPITDPTPILSFLVDLTVATQRRRLRR